MRSKWGMTVAGAVASALALGGCGSADSPQQPGAPAITPSTGAGVPESAIAAHRVPDGDWHTINRDLAATRFSPLTQINRDNVGRLEQAWTYSLPGNTTAVPLVVNGVMYLPSQNRVVALDADSGEEIWTFTLPAAPGGGPGGGVSNRGVSYWPGDDTLPPRIVFMARARMIAVDAATGEPASGFGDNGSAAVGVPYGGTPTIYRHVAIIGAAVGELPQGPPGNTRGFDVRTGEQLWEFNSVPQPGEPYHHTWGDGWVERSGTNQWAFAAPVDIERGIVYTALSSPSPNYYGGGRPGDNVFGNSIVALDALTGERAWHFQVVHHDLWDIDMPSTGALFELTADDGERVPVLAHVNKTSYPFVLNRATGRPHLPIEERPVPIADVPGEWYSPSQPFPALTPPLTRVSFDPEQDLVRPEDTTPEHARACREFMERSGGYYNAGPFTNFLYGPTDPLRSTIQIPGGTGGVNWGGVAVDPNTGIFYANTNTTSLVGWVQDKDPNVTYSFEAPNSPQTHDRASILGVGPFFTFSAPIGGEFDDAGRPVGPTAPCYRPPWGKLVAVNARTGEIVWESVLGLNENLPEGRQQVGSSGSAGPTVTAGGLVFVGATSDRRFRAFDARSGDEIWTARVDGNINANPMSYLGRDGRQYVAAIAGSTVIAYALP
jgi:quinoprotein glucose dehydrogenase